MSEIMLNATARGVMMNEAGHLSFSPGSRHRRFAAPPVMGVGCRKF